MLKTCAAEDGAIAPRPLQEWLSGAWSHREEWGCFPWRGEGADRWIELLKDGQIVTVKAAELEKAVRHSIDPRIRSMIAIPIAVTGVWWGVIGLDDFVQDRDWGEAERDSLRAVADMLGASIARQMAQSDLVEAKETLEQRVLERTGELQDQIAAKDRAHAELAAAQQRLMELSREAGMAEIATGVLHNVGNVLNSVNVSTSLVAGKVRESRVDNLVALVHMLDQHPGDLQEFLATDPEGPARASVSDQTRRPFPIGARRFVDGVGVALLARRSYQADCGHATELCEGLGTG